MQDLAELKRESSSCWTDARTAGSAKLDAAVPPIELCDLTGEAASPDEIAEAASLLCRLVHRSKTDSVMCRAAWHLRRDPALPMRRLASRLGVSEGYLLSGLRAVLGTDPNRLARIAHIAKVIGLGTKSV